MDISKIAKATGGVNVTAGKPTGKDAKTADVLVRASAWAPFDAVFPDSKKDHYNFSRIVEVGDLLVKAYLDSPKDKWDVEIQVTHDIYTVVSYVTPVKDAGKLKTKLVALDKALKAFA